MTVSGTSCAAASRIAQLSARREWSEPSTPTRIPGISAPQVPWSGGSAHLAGHVGLGAGVVWVPENLMGRAVLDQDAGARVALFVAAHRVDGGAVADPRCLLHVVGD